jgi:phage gp36-like protein
MNYLTIDDLIVRYGQADVLSQTDRDGDGVADADVVSSAIADTGALIDTYLAGRYDLPFATIPPPLIRIACDIAWYNLFAVGKAPDHVKTRYDAALELLKTIKSGEVSLGAANVVSNLPKHSAPDRVFNGDTMKDF